MAVIMQSYLLEQFLDIQSQTRIVFQKLLDIQC